MTDRLEWLDRDLVVLWIVAVAVLSAGAILLGSSLSSVVAGILVGSIVCFGLDWWTYEESAKTAGGDQNRQQTPTKHN